jgi:hypothetical protein
MQEAYPALNAPPEHHRSLHSVQHIAHRLSIQRPAPPSNAGSIPSTERTSEHHCSCPCIPYSILPTPELFSGSLQLPSNAGSIPSTERTSEHHCSCPAYRTAYCPHSEPSVLQRPSNAGSIPSTERTSGTSLPTPCISGQVLASQFHCACSLVKMQEGIQN